MRTLRVLLADDERTARRRLERLAGALPGVEVVGACEGAEEALARVRQGGVDLLLLDIEMPGLTGLDASGLVPDDGPVVVFVTAHPEHALDAFGVGAADYLLKPVDGERLRRAVDRVRRRLDARAESGRLALATPRGLRLVDPGSISHAIFDGTTVYVHVDGGRFVVDGTMLQLERLLDDPDRFVRVSRRALVSLDHVELLQDTGGGGYEARLRGGERVVVSRQAARALRRRFGVGPRG